MDPAAPNPLLRSFERHLRAENRADQTVATYLIALRQAEAFLAAARGTTLAEAGDHCPSPPEGPIEPLEEQCAGAPLIEQLILQPEFVTWLG